MAYIDDLQKFRGAINGDDVDQSWQLAHKLTREYPETPLALGDARDLVVLLARAGDRRFEPAAKRWLERIRPNHTQHEMQIAQLAIDGLTGSEKESRRCEKVLIALFG